MNKRFNFDLNRVEFDVQSQKLERRNHQLTRINQRRLNNRRKIAFFVLMKKNVKWRKKRVAHRANWRSSAGAIFFVQIDNDAKSNLKCDDKWFEQERKSKGDWRSTSYWQREEANRMWWDKKQWQTISGCGTLWLRNCAGVHRMNSMNWPTIDDLWRTGK